MKRAIALLGGFWILIVGLCLGTYPAVAGEFSSSAASGAEVYIIAPRNGDTVKSPFTVTFGLKNMGIAPAGIDKDETGHHHLLIDLEELPDLEESLPATENIKHFGGGQTETTLTLAPGTHTLQLLLANYVHVPHRPPVLSEPITITVE